MPYFKNTAGKLHFLEDAKFFSLLPAGCVEITDAEAASIQNPSKTAAQLLDEFKQSARAALESTSVTMERIVEAVSVGTTTFNAADVVSWMEYRKTLRACVNATTVGTLPIKPTYPAGT